MKQARTFGKWRWLALAAAVGASGQAVAQSSRRQVVQEPKIFKLRVTEVDAGVYGEGNFEQTTFQNSGTSVTHERFFLGPTLGLNAAGSIYHPYLFRYQLTSQGAYGFAQDTIKTQTSTRQRTEWQYLGRFSGTADILSYKPYRGNLYGGYDHSYRDYDFFNRVTVDSWRYGARANYNQGPFYLSANYSHRDEEVTGFAKPSVAHDDVVGLDGRYDRARGTSGFNYNFNQYNRSDSGNLSEGRDHTASVTDNERFGSREQFRLNANGSYNRREASFEKIDQFTAQSNLEAEHTDRLSSYYDLSYDRYQSGDFTANNYFGRSELRHQLYSSLSSRLIAQVGDFEGSDQKTTGYTRRYGGGFAESYTKRLPGEHYLRIDQSVLVEHVDQQTLSTIQNERHSFAEGLGGPLGSFFLNQVNVIETSIIVRDQVGIQIWVRGLDYDLIQNGTRTLIERISGSRIPEGAVVVVDYNAEPSPAGGYENLSEFFQVRVDLWKHLWGIYGRLNLSMNNAPERMHIQNLRVYTFGTDVNWRWLRAGGEYVMYDSDQSQYNTARLFQSVTFHPDPASSLSLSLTESWTDYINAHRQEQDYRFITRYRHTFGGNFAMDFEAGVDVRRGPGVDQLLATARPGIEYSIGQLSIKAEYDFEYNLFQNNEERAKHMFFVRAKRVF